MQIFSSQLLMAADDLHGVREFTTQGTHIFKLSRRTKAKLIIVGSGMARTNQYPSDSSWWVAGSGGSCFIGRVILPAGTYTFILNKSTRENRETTDILSGNKTYYIAATSGTNYFTNNTIGTLITAGTQLTLSNNLEIVAGTVEMEANGCSATNPSPYLAKTGGASLYNGYGKGSDASVDNNTMGYFKLEW